MEWIETNKDWIFDGIGVALILSVMGWIGLALKKIPKRIPKSQILNKIEKNYKDFSRQDFTLGRIESNTNNEANMFDVHILFDDKKQKADEKQDAKDLEDFLDKHCTDHKPVLLFGSGGSGKSYSLYKFWKKHAKNTIYIRLYALEEQENAIMSYIKNKYI